MFTAKELAIAYESFRGPVVVAKMAKPRVGEKTFRNNKYSIYNTGRLGAAFGRGGFHASLDRI